jgi:hypothetical protein
VGINDNSLLNVPETEKNSKKTQKKRKQPTHRHKMHQDLIHMSGNPETAKYSNITQPSQALRNKQN